MYLESGPSSTTIHLRAQRNWDECNYAQYVWWRCVLRSYCTDLTVRRFLSEDVSLEEKPLLLTLDEDFDAGALFTALQKYSNEKF